MTKGLDPIASRRQAAPSRRHFLRGLGASIALPAFESGYSCAYQFNLSWSSPTTPRPPGSNPRLAFERLFGAGPPGQRQANLKLRREEQRSILDFALDDARSMRRRLGSEDSQKLD